MKPTLRKVTITPQYSFNVRVDEGNSLLNNWHYHPEFELILLKGSAGTRIIGSSVENFKPNDIVMIGKNVPHTFIHEEKYLNKKRREGAKAIVIHFYDDFWGTEFLSLPELKEIRDLLLTAPPGLCVNEECKKSIIPLMEKMPGGPPIKRLLLLLEILRLLTHKGSHTTLLNEGFEFQPGKEDEGRIGRIFDYTAKNYSQIIRIEDIAELVNLTKESFCRYFKAQTRKTYFQFLTEFRIGHACRMLIENQKSMKEIAHCCGYDNLSNFYHQFKKIIRKSPLEYQEEYFNLASKYDPKEDVIPTGFSTRLESAS